jgi:hypothetical protein
MLKPGHATFAIGILSLLGAMDCALAQEAPMDRTVLPIQEPKAPLYTELDARNAKPPPRFEIKAPDGAPNVLIVLLDDMGFGQSSAFGGPIHMPTVEGLANAGVNGTPQTPIQGVSMMYAVDDHAATDKHVTQYFEIAGNRGLYDHGWLAGTVHKAPWEASPAINSSPMSGSYTIRGAISVW